RFRQIVLAKASVRVREGIDWRVDGVLQRLTASADLAALLLGGCKRQGRMRQGMPADLDERARRQPAKLLDRERPMLLARVCRPVDRGYERAPFGKRRLARVQHGPFAFKAPQGVEPEMARPKDRTSAREDNRWHAVALERRQP